MNYTLRVFFFRSSSELAEVKWIDVEDSNKFLFGQIEKQQTKTPKKGGEAKWVRKKASRKQWTKKRSTRETH